MYESHWQLAEKPFQNTPNPKFLYRTAACDEALSRLQYVAQEGLGAAILTGVFGCGKTMLSHALEDTLQMGFILGRVTNPALDGLGLLREITYQLTHKEELPQEKTELLHVLEHAATENLRDGKRCVAVIDEAHLIDEGSAFEELRLLLNMQSRDAFLLTLVLIGQPELQDKVDQNKALAQRIALRFHIGPLTAEETGAYIQHRLAVSGRTDPIFATEAVQAIHAATGGIPRRINHLCSLCLLAGSQAKASEIHTMIVQENAKELVG